jgi:histidinol-phosphate/aromatic aminotransferase/cobyric acid decarboxylase-like protein
MIDIARKIAILKEKSGTHSPSIATLIQEIPEIKINIDACFLSNPYATDLFFKYFNLDMIKEGGLRRAIEFYPPQNESISELLSNVIGVRKENIFIGNGAIEIIQAILHRFVQGKILILLPTFSSYYEYVLDRQQVVFYYLKKETDFVLDADDYIKFVEMERPDTIVLVNPNNPNGGYIPFDKIIKIIDACSFVNQIIVDESFVHFTYNSDSLMFKSLESFVVKYSNLVVVKSMSKDFGIAGLRAGYSVMNESRIKTLLKNGYLWNINGIACYFFQLYSNSEFYSKYQEVRKNYIIETINFGKNLVLGQDDHGYKVYPTMANFILMELKNGYTSHQVTMDLLIKHNIYVRDCSDKLGLHGEFVRIASRTADENAKILSAIKSLF